jgi:formate dehydrogenase maturation protein FdhE
MSTCPVCGGAIDMLQTGGCGGRGRMVGCAPCDKTWRQVDGGLATSGNTYKPYMLTYKQMAKHANPIRVDA